MRATIGQTLTVAKLTGIVEAVAPSGIVVVFYRVSQSGFTRTGVGELTLLYPCRGAWQVRMMLAIRNEYQQPDMLSKIQRAVFAALGIEEDLTWAMTVCPPCVAEIRGKPEAGFTELSS